MSRASQETQQAIIQEFMYMVQWTKKEFKLDTKDAIQVVAHAQMLWELEKIPDVIEKAEPVNTIPELREIGDAIGRVGSAYYLDNIAQAILSLKSKE